MLIVLPILFIVVITGFVLYFSRRKNQRRDYPEVVREKWLDIQRLCANKKTWTQAVLEADKLLEDVLKAKRYKGKSIGERLVAAQRKLTDNDGVWYAHNLAKKILEKNAKRLKESDVKKALIGFRQALRDLGVLSDK
jgi:hypothetical protein